jgi:hypothetical protein
VPLFEAVRLALSTIRVQKLKSFFSVLGVVIGVMFLIVVVSVVEGMDRYIREDFRLVKKDRGQLVCEPDIDGKHGDTFDAVKLASYALDAGGPAEASAAQVGAFGTTKPSPAQVWKPDHSTDIGG